MKLPKDMSKYVTIIKGISIDKWLMIGLAGLILIFCSDSCANGQKKQDDSSDGTQRDGNASNFNIYNDTDTSMLSDLYMDGYTEKLETELEEILMAIEGAGTVKVMITLKTAPTKEVLMEEPYSESSNIESDGEGGSRDTLEVSRDYRVIYEKNSSGDTVPYVITETSPQVEGVAVIAEGGGSATVKEKITSIIKALFGIEINKIAVGKMK